MDDEEELIKRMCTAIVENDEDALKKLIMDISRDFNFSKYDWISDLFSGPKLDADTKLKFCLIALELKNDDTAGINNFFCRQVIPDLLQRCISENEDEFVYIVSNDKHMQELLVRYVRECPYDSMRVWEKISNLPLIKENILEDDEFIANELTEYEEFFGGLPSEYSHLICYYNADLSEFKLEYLKSLYAKYFGNVTDTKEQVQLIGLHYYLEKKNSIGVSPQIAMKPLKFVLTKLLEDDNFLKVINDFQNRFDIDFISSVAFTHKYYNFPLYKELMETGRIDEKLKEKIRYLAEVNRIPEIETLSDLNDVNIDELKGKEKEVVYVSDISLGGGPISKTNNRVFPDSLNREIRSIKRNGSINRLVVGNQESHESKVEEIYEDDIEFPESCKTVWQRTIESAKQLSAITLVIESEQCHIYMPSNISQEQAEILMQLVETAIDDGRFGIAVYDAKKDKTYISGIDLLDKEGTKDFLLRLNERNLQEDIETGRVISVPNDEHEK